MFNFLLLYHVIFILNVFLINAEVSDKRLCGNADCTEIIGYGQTTLGYLKPSGDPRLLSFKAKDHVEIYSKEAGSNLNLWGVAIDKVRGYVPKTFIRETKVVKKDLEYEVDTELLPVVPSTDKKLETLKPTKLSYVVVDGTTIYDQPSSTENPVQGDVLPDNNLNLKQTEPLPQQPDPPEALNIVNVTPDSKIKGNEEYKESNASPDINDPVATQSDINVKDENVVLLSNDALNRDQSDLRIDESNLQPNVTNTTVQENQQTESYKTPEDSTGTDPNAVPETHDRKELNGEEKLVHEILSGDNGVVSSSTNSASEEIDDEDEGEEDEDEDDEELIEDEVEDEDEGTQVENKSTITSPNQESDLKENTEQTKESEAGETQKEELKNEGQKMEESLKTPLENRIADPQVDLSIEQSVIPDKNKEINQEVTSIKPEFEIPNPYDSVDVVTEDPKKHEEATESQQSSVDPSTSDTLNYVSDNSRNEEANAMENQFVSSNKIPTENQESLSIEDVNVNNVETDKQQLELTETEDESMERRLDVTTESVTTSGEDVPLRESHSNSIIENTESEEVEMHKHDFKTLLSQHHPDDLSCSADPFLPDCKLMEDESSSSKQFSIELPIISYKILIVLVITAVTIVVFLWGYVYIDKRGREGILIGKINDLQKQFLIVQKENELLTNKLTDVECEFNEKSNAVSNEMLLNLQNELEKEQNSRSALEVQIQTLEKELENSTEVGLELNRMLSQFLSSENGSEILVANIEQLQRQIIEQQDLINGYNDNLSMKETENHELRLEVDINNTKVTELQSELNKMALTLLKLEEDKEVSQSNYETELDSLKIELEAEKTLLLKERNQLNEQVKDFQDKYEQVQRNFELKSNEYIILKENINQIKKIENNGDSLKALLDISSVQAELLQLRKDKQSLIEQLQAENNKSSLFEGKYESTLQDFKTFREKYDVADREKVEAITKLEVLDKYFKEREAQLQRELSKQETMWVEKQGEATSTIERIKYMQEELQNYKTQNESLKQEILEQEVQMKSQISMLEKKAHENWVAARQSERKLEDAKQEAAQLRNRLTLRERTLNEEKMHNRIQSPIEHNGEIPVTPTHIANDTATSPPLLFGARENLTISPPIPGLPFLPPPPGVPFMPPPLGSVPLPPPGFMPPPPSLIPGDHRPPPLGRISSPPLNSRFSPDRAYSPYNRNSPSPTSDDDYDRMPIPPLYRGYNSYNRDDRRDDNRRELHRPPPMMGNPRNNKGTGHSSGSANSTESLDKINRHNSKV